MAARCCASAAAACALSPLPSGTTDIRLVLHSHAALPELLDGRTEAEVRALCRLLADCAENTKESWPWTPEELAEALGEYGPYLRA